MLIQQRPAIVTPPPTHVQSLVREWPDETGASREYSLPRPRDHRKGRSLTTNKDSLLLFLTLHHNGF